MTEFNKSSESIFVDSLYEANVGNVVYNFSTRKTNGTTDSIQCSIFKDGAHIGGMYQQNGQKSMNIQQGENASTHMLVFEEFLQTIETM